MTRVEKWRVVHLIWNRQQWRPDRGWYPYTGLSPHTDHLHTEIGQDFSGSQTPRCAGGSAGYSSDSPDLKAFLTYLGGPHYMDAFPRLRSEAGATTAFNLGSFYCRKVAGSTYWSNHAYGTAIDIGIKSIADGDKVRAWLFAEEGDPWMASQDEFDKFHAASHKVAVSSLKKISDAALGIYRRVIPGYTRPPDIDHDKQDIYDWADEVTPSPTPPQP